jgi:hypothetical protein
VAGSSQGLPLAAALLERDTMERRASQHGSAWCVSLAWGAERVRAGAEGPEGVQGVPIAFRFEFSQVRPSPAAKPGPTYRFGQPPRRIVGGAAPALPVWW